jgi:hypothetical protein
MQNIAMTAIEGREHLIPADQQVVLHDEQLVLPPNFL